MPRAKQLPKVDRQTVHVFYKEVAYVAVYVSDDPNLTGLYGVGRNTQAALINFRSVVRRKYPYTHYDVIEHGAGID